MAIQFRCSCGKQMSAQDDFAGRKLKCSQCGELVRIPTPAETDDVTRTIVPKRGGGVAAKAPLASPVPALATAAPLAKPVPLAKPIPITPVGPGLHPWVDATLSQTATPWLPGEEARCQAGIKPMREGLKCWEKLALLVVAAAAIAGAIVAQQFLT